MYDQENYERYVAWFESEFPNDPVLRPSTFEFWRDWNEAMDRLDDQGPRSILDERALEAASKADWERCRSLTDRKSGVTWEELTEATRAAWRIGPALILSTYFRETL